MDEENEEPTEAVRSIHLEAMIKAALGGTTWANRTLATMGGGRSANAVGKPPG